MKWINREILEPALEGRNPSGLLYLLNKVGQWFKNSSLREFMKNETQEIMKMVKSANKKKSKTRKVKEVFLIPGEDLLVVCPDGRQVAFTYEKIQEISH
jgi:hypothetical protein